MANYDNDVIGVGNSNHPANRMELTDREILTEHHCIKGDALQMFDELTSDLEHSRWKETVRTKRLAKAMELLENIKDLLSNSDNGFCIIACNRIEQFINE